MSRWHRLQRWVTGQTVRERPADEDPEALLTRAYEEMLVQHKQKRERAVQAITQKNNLQQMVAETERRVASLDARIQEAGQAGDEALMTQIMREKQSYDQTLQLTRGQLEQAIQTCEQVKEAIKREDEKIRRKTAETLALKTQWRLVQVEEALTISLAQLSAGATKAVTRSQLQQRHLKNRELVVEAITQKNVLESIVAQAREQTEAARAQASSARNDGDEDLERKLLRDMEQNEASLAATDAALRQAIQLSDRARTLLEEESAHFKKLHLTGGAAERDVVMDTVEDDAPTKSDIARYKESLWRALALAILFALVALFIALVFE